MTFEQIRAALTGRMAAFTGIDQANVDYPNQPARIDPPTGLWCRFTVLPGASFMSGMGDAPSTRVPGLVVIQCFAPVQTGEKAITKLVDDLVAHFAYWSSGDLECLEASRVTLGEANGWYQVNVSVRFRAG